MNVLLPALVLSLSPPGVSHSVDEVTVASTARGSVRIDFQVKEGAMVEAGDVLATLDVQAKRAYQQQEMIFASLQAKLRQMQAQVDLNQLEISQATADAEQGVHLSQARLQKAEAVLSLETRSLERRVKLAEMMLVIEQEALELYEVEKSRGRASDADQRRLQIKELEAQLALEESKDRLQMHQAHTVPLETQSAVFAVEAAELERKRVSQEARITHGQVAADLEAAKASRDMQADTLQRLEQQMANSRIKAPAAGRVKLLVPSGATVREGQPVLVIEN